jgi:hypothetical protein
MLRADTIAPVFNDVEKRARATTQVNKLVREGYRSDVSGLAFWAGRDRATTLIAGARHVGTSSLLARNMPAEPTNDCATLRAVDSFVRPKSWQVIPFVSLDSLQGGV